jgi:hypothetical protein
MQGAPASLEGLFRFFLGNIYLGTLRKTSLGYKTAKRLLRRFTDISKQKRKN